MRGRLRIWLAIAICLVVFIRFLAHKPACSESRMLHNKPVPAFRALTADAYAKARVAAVTQLAMVQAVLSPALHIEFPVTRISPPPELSSPRALLSCLLC